MKRRILALLLVLSMVMVWVPSSVFAAETASGTCGENLTWTLEDGVLTISGTGEMDSCYSGAPWADTKDTISKVVILEGVTSIEDYAFAWCYSLENVTIPEGVTSIGDCAFYGCKRLTSLAIPSSVSSIDGSAFSRCSSLAGVFVCEDNNFFCNDEFGVLYNKGKTKLVTVPKGMEQYIVPHGVTSIGECAFQECGKLTSIKLPTSVISIGESAFEDCSSLCGIYIPEGVSNIGRCAFCNCISLTSIAIPEGVTSIGWYLFGECSNLTSISLPDSITSIGLCAFVNCSSLTSIALPDGVTNIERRAFEGCSSLTSIRIPSSVINIGEGVLGHCKSLVSIYVSAENEHYCNDEFGVLYNKDKTKLIQAPGAIVEKEYVVPEGVTSIEPCAFYGGTLTSIVIPDGVTNIENSTFEGCSGLVSISIPESVTSIGNNAFAGCSDLTNITIPEGVIVIGWSAFYGCNSLTNIAVPEGVTSIESCLFYECSSLVSITLPNSITSIKGSAFEGCSSLTNITIPDEVTYIGAYAFYGCNSLVSIIIPESVTSIGDGAFILCDSLTDVYYGGIKERWNAIAIADRNDNLTDANIHFGKGCPHNWDSGEVVIMATCEEDGVKTCTCTTCGETKTETIAATGHSWDKGTVSKESTATEQGEKTYTCTVCGETKTEAIAVLSNPFTDLVENSSYYDPVLWAVKNGITTGTSDTEFSPKADCTRAQIVTFLWRCAGKPEPATAKHNFVDLVENSSYYKAVLWAVEKGITTGLDKTRFGPKEPCTRAQIVTFLWRAAGKPEPSSQKHNFTDIVKGSSYYDAVLWAVEKGITTGADATHFAPKDTCTRAQGMTFLYRYHNNK